MKALMSLIRTILILCTTLISAHSFACPSADAIRHTNPDGSLGGFKDLTAKVEATVTLGPNAKVCGKSWISGNVKILDRSVVDGKFWVKGNVEISGNALVRGAGVAEAVEEKSIEIKGNSKVTGAVKIYGGTRIQDMASVSGYGSFTDTVISKSAKVCDSYNYNDQNIQDEIFCSHSVKKIFDVSRGSYKSDWVNPNEKNLVINSPKGQYFSTAENETIVFVNGYILNHGARVRRGYIEIEKDNLRDGKNEVYVRTIDKQKNIIQTNPIQFYASSEKAEFAVPNLVSKIAFSEAVYEVNGEIFYADVTISNSTIFVRKLITEEYLSARLRITLISKSQFFSDTISSEATSPEIRMIDIPIMQSNDIRFSQDMRGWGVSHDANYHVTYDVDPKLKITVPPGKSVSFVRKINSQEISNGVSVNAALVGEKIDATREEELQVSMGIASVANGKIYIISESHKIHDYTPRRILALSPQRGTEYILFYRVESNTAANKASEPAVIETDSPTLVPSFLVSFHNFGIRNIAAPATGWSSKLDTDFSSKCLKSDFPISEEFHEALVSNTTGLSLKTNRAGELLGRVSRNRLWGIFYLFGMKDFDYERLKATELSVVRLRNNQKIVSKVPVASCVREMIGNPQYWRGGVFNQTNNIASPIFDFAFPNLGGVEFSSDELVRLEVRVPPSLNDGNELIFSEVVPIFIPLRVEDTYVYNRSGGDSEDYYDNRELNTTRTGGDKWVAIGYEDPIRDIIRRSYPNGKIWKINDASMLNGANFGHRATHSTGIDFDLPFGCSIFPSSYSALCNGSSLTNLSEDIENFIKTIPLHKVSDLYITIPPLSSLESRRAILSPLENRCFANGGISESFVRTRYISFGIGAAPGAGRSIVRNVLDHSSHLHVRMAPMDASRRLIQMRSLGKEFLRNDFIKKLTFSVSGSRLSVSLKDKPKPSDEKIMYAWRVQEKSGFDRSVRSLCTGFIDQNGKTHDTTNLSGYNCDGIKWGEEDIYLSILIASYADGECLQFHDGNDFFIKIKTQEHENENFQIQD